MRGAQDRTGGSPGRRLARIVRRGRGWVEVIRAGGHEKLEL
jgi:hypothetical protein